MEMELKAKSEPKEYSEKSGSAHQFSMRSMSIQADSEELEEINMQTSIIDYKNKKSKQVVNIYDLSQKKKNKSVGPKLLKEMKDVSLTADFNRQFIST